MSVIVVFIHEML